MSKYDKNKTIATSCLRRKMENQSINSSKDKKNGSRLKGIKDGVSHNITWMFRGSKLLYSHHVTEYIV